MGFVEGLYKRSIVLYTLFFKPRWFWCGIFIAVGIIILCKYVPFHHSTNTLNHYSIAWTYVTLVVAVVSILYPLSLNIRDSLTSRVVGIYDKLDKNGDGTEISKRDKDSIISAIERMAKFRYNHFDKQLPFLVAFSATTVVRVLLCLLGVSFLSGDSFEQQLLEPQVFVLFYFGWIIWVAITILKYQPFKTVETLELDIRKLPSFEEIAKPFLSLEQTSSQKDDDAFPD